MTFYEWVAAFSRTERARQMYRDEMDAKAGYLFPPAPPLPQLGERAPGLGAPVYVHRISDRSRGAVAKRREGGIAHLGAKRS